MTKRQFIAIYMLLLAISTPNASLQTVFIGIGGVSAIIEISTWIVEAWRR